MARGRGFTIVELMIGLALMAILMALALPSFSGMLRNWKVRATADTITAGLQLARAEAIKRNADVRFALVDNAPSAIGGSTGPTYSAAETGAHWAVFALASGTYELIDGRANGEGSSANASATPGSTNKGEIIFDSMGRARELTANGAFAVTSTSGTCASTTDTSGDKVRCLRVVVTPAGSVRMCDPAVSDATDPRICP